MATFDDLHKLLSAHSTSRITPGLERISRLLGRLGNPQNSFMAVHIVGTNGKGSTGAFISSVLTAAGCRTAFYSSPHLISLGERLMVDGKTLSADDWIRAVKSVVNVMHDDDGDDGDDEDMPSCPSPSYFELLTAGAFVLIREQGVKIGVIEAGLGGRLDATNVLGVVPVVVVSSIGMDHTEYLGHRLGEIAGEKFAVIRPNTPALYYGDRAELVPMFREKKR